MSQYVLNLFLFPQNINEILINDIYLTIMDI